MGMAVWQEAQHRIDQGLMARASTGEPWMKHALLCRHETELSFDQRRRTNTRMVRGRECVVFKKQWLYIIIIMVYIGGERKGEKNKEQEKRNTPPIQHTQLTG